MMLQCLGRIAMNMESIHNSLTVCFALLCFALFTAYIYLERLLEKLSMKSKHSSSHQIMQCSAILWYHIIF
ncbi:hypothetical protein BDW59DRAFT_74439 [Aspergillus cavernicola]|uniref:Copper transporter n=1 Tax=Aspergillus cavernicola TaxID=176166 RepID=A0ABR4IBM2_9EURO